MRRHHLMPVRCATLMFTAAAMALLLPSFVLAGQSSSETSSTPMDDQATMAAGDTQNVQYVTAGELADHPDRYYATTLSVTAPVEDVFSSTMFSLDEDKVWSTGRDVLVLNPRPTAAATSDHDVTVVGTLHRFVRGDIERMFNGWSWDLQPKLMARFDQRPVLIATSIRTEDGRQLVRARSGESDRQTSNHSGTRQPARSAEKMLLKQAAAIVSAGNLADHPDRYYGKRVSVTADVEDVYSRSVFALDEDKRWSTGEDVLVIAPDLKKPIDDSSEVTVTGKVIRFDKANIERQLQDYALDLRPNLVEDFNQRPVVLATSVRTAQGQELLTPSS